MQTNKPFEPISIHLTTQAEVDFFYTLVANAPDLLVGDYGLGAEVNYLTSFLADNTSEEYFDNFEVEDYYPEVGEPLEDFCQDCQGGCGGFCEDEPKSIGELMRRGHTKEPQPLDTRCTYSGAEFYEPCKPCFDASGDDYTDEENEMFNDLSVFFQQFKTINARK